MGIREDIAEESFRQRLIEFLDEEIEMAEYENKPTGDMRVIRDKYKTAFTESGNIRHFED